MLDLNEDYDLLHQKCNNNREDLIKLNVRNSQLDSQTKMLEIEEEQLTEGNKKLIEHNSELEAENLDLKKKIATTIQRIDINNLLKEIDIEELKILAKNNKQMNFAMENLITKWSFIQAQELPGK